MRTAFFYVWKILYSHCREKACIVLSGIQRKTLTGFTSTARNTLPISVIFITFIIEP